MSRKKALRAASIGTMVRALGPAGPDPFLEPLSPRNRDGFREDFGFVPSRSDYHDYGRGYHEYAPDPRSTSGIEPALETQRVQRAQQRPRSRAERLERKQEERKARQKNGKPKTPNAGPAGRRKRRR